MASKKPTPKVSRISRDRTVAYARKQKPGSAGPDDAAEPDAASPAPVDAAAPTSSVAQSLYDASATAAPTDVTASMAPVAPPAAETLVMPPPATSGPPSADAAETMMMPAAATAVTAPMDAVEPSRARTATVAMPIQASLGAPPAMPAEPVAAIPPIDPMLAEAPTRMPGPREIPGGNPEDPASPPGGVPRGDSRSMRRRTERYEFALIYRMQTYVICRFGAVGTRGQWRVVEYPTSASASHAYAKEVSRFVSEGFSDYRD